MADVNLAPGLGLKARDHAHRRGLATSGGPQQNEKLLVVDLDAQVVYRDDAAKMLRDAAKRYVGHLAPSGSLEQPKARPAILSAKIEDVRRVAAGKPVLIAETLEDENAGIE